MDTGPVVVKDWRKNHLWGLVSLSYHVEDRRPDLEEYSGKYKHFLVVRVLAKTYGWTFRTNYLYDLPNES